MPSFAMVLLDWMDAHPEAKQDQVMRAYEEIPPKWFAVHYAELREKCPSRRGMIVERRPANALNIEIGQPMDRCLEKSPDGRGMAWLWSGGSLLAYGLCEGCKACPRAALAEVSPNGNGGPA
jgi:hypothetical protein